MLLRLSVTLQVDHKPTNSHIYGDILALLQAKCTFWYVTLPTVLFIWLGIAVKGD